jgi:hypothetical protein
LKRLPKKPVKGEDYLAVIRSVPSRRDIDAIRRHTKTGRPLGGPGFSEEVEETDGRTLSVKRAGRPRKQGNKPLDSIFKKGG